MQKASLPNPHNICTYDNDILILTLALGGKMYGLLDRKLSSSGPDQVQVNYRCLRGPPQWHLLLAGGLMTLIWDWVY